MEGAEMESVLRGIVVKNAPRQIESVAHEHRLAEDHGLDSLAFVLSIADLEERLGVVIAPERAGEMAGLTFGELVALVRREREGGDG
jgi:acyl carrier protein